MRFIMGNCFARSNEISEVKVSVERGRGGILDQVCVACESVWADRDRNWKSRLVKLAEVGGSEAKSHIN